MEPERPVISVLLSLIFLFCGCAATKLSDYEAKSPEESELLSFFVECDAAYQSEDYTKWLACFHDNAKIRVYQTDAGTRKDISKPEYKVYLADGRAAEMPYELVNPVIDIEEEKASLKYRNALLPQLRLRFDFVKDRDSWQITRWDWTYRGE